MGAGWFLDKVVIKPVDKSKSDDDDNDDDDDDDAGRRFVFACDRWLDVGEDDHLIERELMRLEKEETEVLGEYSSCFLEQRRKRNYNIDTIRIILSVWLSDDPWKVHLTTGGDANASTAERVALVIYGANGKSMRNYLGSEGQLKGQGETDIFDIMVRPDLGQVYKVRVGFGNLKEKNITWQLDKVSCLGFSNKLSC